MCGRISGDPAYDPCTRVKGEKRLKYLVMLCDGMADEPLEELGGKTPLQAARTPVMDAMAKVSEQGDRLHGAGEPSGRK